MKETEVLWRELVTKKDEFLHILRILNHYYEMQGETKSKQFAFRRHLADSPPESVQIFSQGLAPMNTKWLVGFCPKNRRKPGFILMGSQKKEKD